MSGFMSDVTAESHFLVVDDEGSPLIEDGTVLLQAKKDDTYVYVPLSIQIQQEFGVQNDNDRISNNDSGPVISCSKMEKEHVSKCSNENEKFIWHHKSTLLLLDEYKKRIQKFRNPKVKKKLLWEEISQVMNQHGFPVDADLLDRKIRNMKNTYRNILDNNNKKKSTGKGRIQWEYFNIFEEILKEDKTVNFSPVMTSTNESEILQTTSNELSNESTTMPNNEQIEDRPSSSASNTSSGTPTSKKHTRSKQLDKFRNRQLQIEEEKLTELKRLRESVDKNNEIEQEKVKLLKLLVEKQPT